MAQSDLQKPQIDNTIFIPGIAVVVLTAIALLVFPDTTGPFLNTMKEWVTVNTGWVFLFLTAASLVFALWLAFSRYGNVKLGEPDEKPEYSNLHWIAMMFTCGVGGGMIVWGFAEPMYYLSTPPLGADVGSTRAKELAHVYPLFHWGISAWSVYVVPAIPIAYMLYVKKRDVLRVSTVVEDMLPQTGRTLSKTIIDIVILFGVIGGNATALGLGVPLVSALLAEFLGVDDSLFLKIGLLMVWAALFGFSVYRGLKRGIKILADINMVLAVIAILFIFLVGPTLFILNISVNSLGILISDFFRMSLWTDPIEKSTFPQDWTIFYWAWYLAFAAFVGLFIARISRGRTIRQMIIGVLTLGTLGTSLFMMVMGGYALHAELNGVLPASEILANEGMFAMTAKLLSSLPAGKFVLLVFLILSTIFYATNVDSAAYILSSISSKNLRSDQEPPRSNRLIWALALTALTAGLIYTGSTGIVQAATIVAALPLVPIFIMMCVALVKWLREDFGDIT